MNCIFQFRPDLPRPIRVNILIPIVFLIVCLVLVIVPSIYEPINLVINVAIIVSGIPVYYVCVKWKNKPKTYNQISNKLERFCQLFFNTIFINEEEEKSEK
jgi:solute carrier family 7 (L-type amino acid transporter), member 5